jgi:hypothetical protein
MSNFDISYQTKTSLFVILMRRVSFLQLIDSPVELCGKFSCRLSSPYSPVQDFLFAADWVPSPVELLQDGLEFESSAAGFHHLISPVQGSLPAAD